MTSTVISGKEEIEAFLKELKRVLMQPDFDLSQDLDISLDMDKEATTGPNSAERALRARGFAKSGLVYRLMGLEVTEYLETSLAEKDPPLPPYFVFVKATGSSDVCLKVRIRDTHTGKVFCVQLNFVRFPFLTRLPYA